MPDTIRSKSINISKYNLTHDILGEDNVVNIITCYSDEGFKVGDLVFYQKGQVPASKMFPNISIKPYYYFLLNVEIDRFQDIIATLRYEKPLTISLHWETNNVITHGAISANSESIGEQEGV